MLAFRIHDSARSAPHVPAVQRLPDRRPRHRWRGVGADPRQRRSACLARGRHRRQAAGLGEGAQREGRGGDCRHAGVQAAGSGHPRDPRFGPEDRLRRRHRRAVLQPVEGQGPRARPVAAHHAGRVPQAQPEVGNRARHRRLEQGRRRELGLARRLLPAPGVPALPDLAVARRFRCRRHPRVRPGRQGLGQGRLLSAGGEGRAGLDRPGHGVRLYRFRSRHADQLRLSQHRQGMEARHADGQRDAGVRGSAGRHVHRRGPRQDAGLPPRLRVSHHRVLERRTLPARQGWRPDQGRGAEHRAEIGAQGLVAAGAARVVHRGREDLQAGLADRDPLRRLHGRQARFHRAVRA